MCGLGAKGGGSGLILVVVGGSYPPARHPLAPYMSDIVKALVALGRRVAVLASVPGAASQAGESVVDVGAGDDRRMGGARSRLRTFREIVRRRRESSMIVTASVRPSSLFPALLISRLLRLKLVAAVAGDAHTEWSWARKGAISRLVTAIRLWLMVAALRRADVVTAPPDLLDRLESHGVPRDRMVGTMQPVDVEQFRPAGTVPRPELVAFTSVIAEERGSDLMVAAFRRVLREVPGAELWMVGDGRCRKHLEEEVRSSGLADRIRFVDWLPRERMSEALAPVAIVANPRPFGVNLSYPTAEAMAMGKAVVVTRFGKLIEATMEPGDNDSRGVLVPVGDEKALASAIIRLARDPEMAGSIGRRAREFAERELSYAKYRESWGRVLSMAEPGKR